MFGVDQNHIHTARDCIFYGFRATDTSVLAFTNATHIQYCLAYLYAHSSADNVTCERTRSHSDPIAYLAYLPSVPFPINHAHRATSTEHSLPNLTTLTVRPLLSIPFPIQPRSLCDLY